MPGDRAEKCKCGCDYPDHWKERAMTNLDERVQRAKAVLAEPEQTRFGNTASSLYYKERRQLASDVLEMAEELVQLHAELCLLKAWIVTSKARELVAVKQREDEFIPPEIWTMRLD